MPIRPGMTRCSICPSVSFVRSSGPGPLQQGAAALRQRQGLAPQERVVVGDDDLRPLQVAEHVVRHQLAARVVAVRIVGLEHAQPIADRHAGGHDQETARELPAARPAHRVDGLPGDEHRHDGGLAGAGGELQRQPREARIGLLARLLEMLEDLPLLPAALRGDLGQPDRGLHRLDLTRRAGCRRTDGCASAAGAAPSPASPARSPDREAHATDPRAGGRRR